jgi:hypothetical protein
MCGSADLNLYGLRDGLPSMESEKTNNEYELNTKSSRHCESAVESVVVSNLAAKRRATCSAFRIRT